MEEIYDTNDAFDFSKLSLSSPTSMGSGTFFIRYQINNTPLYIQPPKCSTKQGILKSGKKFYTDLIFTNENENFIRWMENLESYSQKFIYNNREQWFEGDMEMHDIENYFTSLIRVYKSGKYYNVRVNLQTVLGKPLLKIYDENENNLALEDITDKTNVMTILEISGIKCSSRSFQIEIELKQMMTLKPSNMFEKILLKSNSSIGGTTENLPLTDTTQHNIVPLIDDPVPVAAPSPLDKDLDQRLVETGGESSYPDNFISSPVPPIDLEKSKIDENEGNKENKEIEEIDLPLEELRDTDVIHIKQRNDIYYSMYREARKKAKIARDFALSSYLEVKKIKNMYMLDDVEDSDDGEPDFDENDQSVI